MKRGWLSWLFTIPKVPLPRVPPGGPNWTRLNVLKNSVRNCKPSLFSGPKFVVLYNAMSQLLIPAPRIVASTRDSSPKPHSAGGVKQLVLNQTISLLFGTVVCAALLLHPGTTFGRRPKFCVKPACEIPLTPPKEIGRGKPF